MKIEKTIWANAFGLTATILWILCSAFVLVLPGPAAVISEWWMHGLSLMPMGGFNLTLNNFILGGATLIISAWGTGYVLGWSLEYLGKKR